MIKDLGQNFLTDDEVLHNMIDAAELQHDDVVLEVGPGKGVLTVALAERVGRVTAVELDRSLVSNVEQRYRKNENPFQCAPVSSKAIAVRLR